MLRASSQESLQGGLRAAVKAVKESMWLPKGVLGCLLDFPSQFLPKKIGLQLVAVIGRRTPPTYGDLRRGAYIRSRLRRRHRLWVSPERQTSPRHQQPAWPVPGAQKYTLFIWPGAYEQQPILDSHGICASSSHSWQTRYAIVPSLYLRLEIC
jgi:hypothetical protein